KLCGKSRPGHFRGVATIVSILLNVVRPHFAFFGQKDAQQTVVIKRMARDLKIDVEVVVGPIVREQDGLALSSRNAYLNPDERKAAPVIFKSLEKVKSMFGEGVRDAGELLTTMNNMLGQEPMLRLDYSAIVDAETLESISEIERRQVIVAVAAFI